MFRAEDAASQVKPFFHDVILISIELLRGAELAEHATGTL